MFNLIRVIVPLIFGNIIMDKCPKPENTPDPIGNTIRELMWPMLLLAIGFAWYLTTKAQRGLHIDAMYAVTTGIIIWWFHTQFCAQNVEQSRLIMLLIAMVTTGLVFFSARYSATAGISLSVVLIWLLFAEQLNLPNINIRLPSIKLTLPQISVKNNGAPITISTFQAGN